jgi:hypothetical protein
MIDETSSKYMEIYDIAKNIYDKTKYYTYNQTRNTFIKKWTEEGVNFGEKFKTTSCFL